LARSAPIRPPVRGLHATAPALYATVSQAILPPGATDEQRARLERYERDNAAPWKAASVAQFRSGMKSGRVRDVAGVHHLFPDRPGETLRAVRGFLRAAPGKNRE
jgi:hypothetical protein